MFDKLNLNGIPNRQVLDKEDRYKLLNEQNSFVVDRLREAYPNVEWYTTNEFMSVDNPEQNRILGDIIGTRKNKDNMKPDVFINIRVFNYGAQEQYFGSIALDTILGFLYKQINHYYIFCNSTGSDWFIISCFDVYNLLTNKTTKCLIENKYKRKDDPKYDKFIIKYIYKKQFPGVSRNDFVPGSVLKRYNKRRII